MTTLPPNRTKLSLSMDLREELRQRQVDAMIADAEFVCSQPESDERDNLLAIERRRAMYRFAVGHITLPERNRILNALNEKDDIRSSTYT